MRGSVHDSRRPRSLENSSVRLTRPDAERSLGCLANIVRYILSPNWSLGLSLLGSGLIPIVSALKRKGRLPPPRPTTNDRRLTAATSPRSTPPDTLHAPASGGQS